MLRTIAYCKQLVASAVMDEVLQQCNLLILTEHGAHARLAHFPDLLVVVKNSDNGVSGMMVLHYTEGTKAWEIGVFSSAKRYFKDEMLKILINGAIDAVSTLQNRDIMDKRVWLVKRVRHSDTRRKSLFLGLGFECTDSFLDSVLSDAGYIPFDPFDTSLMKRVVQA
jgi:hypothetical protein